MTEDNPNPSDNSTDLGSVAVAFSAVSGVLGGFCITILVLALTLPNATTSRRIDWLAAVIMSAAAIYITSAGYLVNAHNTLVHSFQSRRRNFSRGILLFHLGNLFLSVSFILIAYPLRVTFVVAIIISLYAMYAAAWNVYGFIVRWTA